MLPVICEKVDVVNIYHSDDTGTVNTTCTLIIVLNVVCKERMAMNEPLFRGDRYECVSVDMSTDTKGGGGGSKLRYILCTEGRKLPMVFYILEGHSLGF